MNNEISYIEDKIIILKMRKASLEKQIEYKSGQLVEIIDIISELECRLRKIKEQKKGEFL